MHHALSGDIYDIALGHNAWAIGRVLEMSRPLTTDQFHQRFPIGPGSLHDTCTHMIGAMLRWADRISGRDLRPSIEKNPAPNPGEIMARRTIDELLALRDQARDDFASVVAEVRAKNRLGDLMEITLPSDTGTETYRFTYAAAILHLTNHGMHHRAQCLNMFRHLGMTDLPDLDELEWQVAGQPE
ncbi:MAG: DinB family protein [Phycisphaeraceae bacterium]|nr:DinB family protein [Phycisphaerales bacterium]MCB9860867.1 DinB family protein [Phycisphaeraceae bacterium]